MELLCECDTQLWVGGGFAKGGDVVAFTPKEALERRKGIIRRTTSCKLDHKYTNPITKMYFLFIYYLPKGMFFIIVFLS